MSVEIRLRAPKARPTRELNQAAEKTLACTADIVERMRFLLV